MQDSLTREPATAELLDGAAMPLAGYAAEKYLGAGNGEGSAANPFHWWQSYLASRLRDLCAAVNLGRPSLFARQLSWCQDALSAKGVDAETFRSALQALAEVVADELPDAGPRIARQYIHPAIAAIGQSPTDFNSTLDTSTQTGRLTASYILAILEGDRRKAAELIHGALVDGLEIKRVYLDVLSSASREIGLMWHRSEISIAEEHFATATTQMVMSQLLGRSSKPQPNGKTVVVASVVGDRHGLGTQVVSDFFEMDGWRVIYLGPDIPGQELPQALIDFNADLLLLSATMYTHLRAMEATIRAVKQADDLKAVPVLVGGHAFAGNPGLVEQIGADGYAEDAGRAVTLGRDLVGLQ